MSLFAKIKSFIERPTSLIESETEFNELALELFAYQFERNPIYQKICLARQLKPLSKLPQYWKEIPLISTDLFKKQKLYSGKQEPIKLFRSSGTTNTDRSIHYLSVEELELYETSLWKTFSQAFCLPRKVDYFILDESPTERGDSSLIHMFETIRKKIKAKDNTYFVKNGVLLFDELISTLNKSIEADTPVLLVGTAFSFVHLVDSLEHNLKLPSGSVIMETGGFKGKSRELKRTELYAAISDNLGLPVANIIGQYGMSELGTQYYDSSFRLQPNPPQTRLKKCPHWSKIRVINPNNLQEEVPEGEMGLLAHYDLANIDSCAFVLTGDIGVRQENNTFELIGRAKKLSLKGCSLMNDFGNK